MHSESSNDLIMIIIFKQSDVLLRANTTTSLKTFKILLVLDIKTKSQFSVFHF